MSTDTTTIRVSLRTRDRLAAQARERGLSLAALLTRLADQSELEAIYRAEREVARAEASAPAAVAEEADWETVLGDGVA